MVASNEVLLLVRSWRIPPAYNVRTINPEHHSHPSYCIYYICNIIDISIAIEWPYYKGGLCNEVPFTQFPMLQGNCLITSSNLHLNLLT